MNRFEKMMQTGLMKTFDMRVEQSDASVIISMPITDAIKQPFGYVHGGVNVALCETVASYGSALNVDEHHIPLGQEINANHIKSAQTGRLKAIGHLLHKGNTSHVWDIKVYNEEQLICVSRCTVAIKKIRR